MVKPPDTPDFEAEPKTDPRLIPALRRHDQRAARKTNLKFLAWAVGVVASGLVFIDNRVRAQTDAGVAVHEARIGTLEQQRTLDRTEANGRFERIEAQGSRTEAKIDALLQRFSVPNPAPAPRDGGH